VTVVAIVVVVVVVVVVDSKWKEEKGVEEESKEFDSDLTKKMRTKNF
jgi:hypothetical protein